MKPTQHIVNLSGGKDSASVMLLAMDRGVDFTLAMADTDNEDQQTYDHAQLLARHAGRPLNMVRADFSKQIRAKAEYIRLVWPQPYFERSKEFPNGKWYPGVSLGTVARALSVMHPTGNPFLDLCLWKGRFPSRMAQFCTEELKVLPVLEQIVLPRVKLWRRGEAGPVLQWLGERAEESERRRNKPRFNRGDAGAYLWRPIKTWTIEDVLAIHRRHGVPMNPLYSQGMTRVGCMPCINCKKDELRQISVRFPQHIDKIAEWEELVGSASRLRLATFFAPLGKDNTINPIRDVVEWSRTARGGRQYDLVHEMEDTTSGCHSSLGLCE